MKCLQALIPVVVSHCLMHTRKNKVAVRAQRHTQRCSRNLRNQILTLNWMLKSSLTAGNVCCTLKTQRRKMSWNCKFIWHNILYVWALQQAKTEVHVVQYVMLCHLVSGCQWVEAMKWLCIQVPSGPIRTVPVLLSVANDGTAYLWYIRNRQPHSTLSHTGRPNPQQTDCEVLTSCNKKLVIFEVLTVILLKIGVL